MLENIIHGAAARALMVFHDFPSSLWNGSKKIIHKVIQNKQNLMRIISGMLHCKLE